MKVMKWQLICQGKSYKYLFNIWQTEGLRNDERM
jgi:hypothetical protein